MRVWNSLVALLAAVFCCVTPAVAGAPFPLKPSLEFGPDSKFAMIVFEAEPAVAPDWTLVIDAFSPESKKWTYTMLDGWAQFGKINARDGQRNFYAALVKPSGTYAVNRLSVQNLWGACFNGGTKAFTVETGKINFIGLVDPNPSLKLISEKLPQSARLGSHVDLYDEPTLSMTPPSALVGWQTAVAGFIAEKFPKSTAPIVGAEPIDVTFEPSHGMTGKTCEKY